MENDKVLLLTNCMRWGFRTLSSNELLEELQKLDKGLRWQLLERQKKSTASKMRTQTTAKKKKTSDATNLCVSTIVLTTTSVYISIDKYMSSMINKRWVKQMINKRCETNACWKLTSLMFYPLYSAIPQFGLFCCQFLLLFWLKQALVRTLQKSYACYNRI